MKKVLLFIYILSAFVSLRAEVVMPKIFSDNMVLQRQMPVRIWGKATPDSLVGIEFMGQKIETKAKEDGTWLIYLRPLKANNSPSIMKIYEEGQVSKEIKNILVGEVWVAGGQSNMQRSMAQINAIKKDSKRAENPMIRMFTQPHDAATTTVQYDSPEGAKWELAKAHTIKEFSAISFIFAEELSRKLEVPVAVIQTSLGGSKMIAWLSEADVANSPAFENDLKNFTELNENYNYEEEFALWKEAKARFEQKKSEAKKADKKSNKKKDTKVDRKNFPALTRMPIELSPLSIGSTPSYLYNAKIAPIKGYTARGFLWYQGEADAKVDVEKFSEKFETLIRSWRKYWGKNMPFYFVQLPSFGNTNEGWVEARWQQYLTKQKLRLVEMVVSIDTGEEKNIHPTDKEIISKRLAKIAQKRVYNNRFMTGEYGPMLKSVSYDGYKAVVSFNLFGRTLRQKGDLRGFEILVDDKWVAPLLIELDVEKECVILESPVGTEIKGVRYLWKAWAKPDISLYSDLNLPAMGFRDEKKDLPLEPLSLERSMPPLKKKIQIPRPVPSTRQTVSMGDWRNNSKKNPKEDSNLNKDKNDESL